MVATAWPRRLSALTAVLAALAATGCGGGNDRPASGPDADRTLTVMTWNLFIGTDVSPLLTVSTPAELAEVTTRLYEEVESSDFADRAEAVADAVGTWLPDVIALQEAALWRTQAPPDGSRSDATDAALDFIELLDGALRARGLVYALVVATAGVDAEIETPSQDIRFTDREVLLVREDAAGVTVTDSEARTFETNLEVDSPLGGTLTVVRGFASANVLVGESAVRVISTHLEVAPFRGIQIAQADELAADALDAGTPVVLMGDINSPADGSGTDTYQRLVDAGFADAWALSKAGDGFTCCHEPGLRTAERALDERIDVAMLLGNVEVLEAHIVGEEQADRSPAGRWPSDHAGLVVTLRLG